MEFPEVIEASVSQFATFIPARNPEFKVHKNEGLANSALGQRSYREHYAKYELVGGEWVRVFEHHPGTHCPKCKNEYTTDYWGYYIYYCPDDTKPSWNQEPICSRCWGRKSEIEDAKRKEKQEREQLKRLQAKYGNN